MSFQKRISVSLKKRKLENSFRVRTIIDNSKTSRFLIHNSHKYLNFASNDYLGLSYHPAVIQAWQSGAECYGIGSGSSGHINGYTRAHYLFEEELANWLGYPRALLFISGFAANQAVIFSLMQKHDYIFADRLSHASLLEAAKLSPANLRRFHHNDIDNLSFLLQRPRFGQFLVITEGIFSMDGDTAPLRMLDMLIKKENGWLMVDDAHGFGIIGKNGMGSCEHQNIKPELLIITFSKSAGVSGAAVLCDENVADYLLQHAKHLIYSTSMPPAQVKALLASLNILRSEEGEEKRQKLAQHIRQFREGAASLHMLLSDSNYAIQPLIIGKNSSALEMTELLRKKNVWTVAIRPPSVPKGTARLRLTLSAAHETSDIFVLLEALHDTSKQTGDSCSI